MRFHLMMLLVVILVSLGMHGLASAMPAGVTHVPPGSAAGDAAASVHVWGERF